MAIHECKRRKCSAFVLFGGFIYALQMTFHSYPMPRETVTTPIPISHLCHVCRGQRQRGSAGGGSRVHDHREARITFGILAARLISETLPVLSLSEHCGGEDDEHHQTHTLVLHRSSLLQELKDKLVIKLWKRNRPCLIPDEQRLTDES